MPEPTLEELQWAEAYFDWQIEEGMFVEGCDGVVEVAGIQAQLTQVSTTSDPAM